MRLSTVVWDEEPPPISEERREHVRAILRDLEPPTPGSPGTALRRAYIRLAHEHPNLRAHLLAVMNA
jgi:hypothetical protein